MDKVSIIVPVFNTENYVYKCLTSVINQTYSNIEVILINDGSTDKSENICYEFSKLDSRIKFINRENRGVSYTRNQGIEESTGKYICFIDSDDYIQNNYIENMLKHMENSDLITCAYAIEFKNKKRNIIFGENIKDYNRDEALKLMFSSNMYKGFLWNKLFKKEIIVKEKIRFNNDISMCEDLLFVYEYIFYSKEIRYIPEVGYFYKMRKSSLSNNLKNIETALLAYESIFALLNKNNIEFDIYLLESFINININILLIAKKKSKIYLIAKKNIREYKDRIFYQVNFKTKIMIFIGTRFPKLLFFLKKLRDIVCGKNLFD